MNFNYFFGDSIDRKLIYTGNDNLIRISDELWVFGKIADGVASEIIYCSEILKKPIKYFSIQKDSKVAYNFTEIKEDQVEIEEKTKEK